MKSLFVAALTAAGALLSAFAAPFGHAAEGPSPEFQLKDVPTLPPFAASALAPRIILFTDHRSDELVDQATGLIRFSEWARSRPQQKQLLGLFPSYEEPTAGGNDATGKPRRRGIHVYVAEARFVLSKPAGSIDLSRMITLDLIQQLDPAIKDRVITAADAIPNKDPKSANRNPQRAWCEGDSVICMASQYRLEGRLPTGILLVNKLRESGKKISDTLEFQSELRLVPQREISQAALPMATGVESPIIGAVEQNIFYINQVMQFGKFLAVLQGDPADARKSVVTAFIALGVDSDLFEKKKEFENVPVLRNLVPAQVLAGNSTFNTGNSISAGLPKYSRNRVKALAAQLDK